MDQKPPSHLSVILTQHTSALESLLPLFQLIGVQFMMDFLPLCSSYYEVYTPCLS